VYKNNSFTALDASAKVFTFTTTDEGNLLILLLSWMVSVPGTSTKNGSWWTLGCRRVKACVVLQHRCAVAGAALPGCPTYCPSFSTASKDADRLLTGNFFPHPMQDAPGNPSSSNVLVNDLDLKVESPDGSEVFWGNNVDGGDRHNNNERVGGLLCAV